MKVYRMSVVDKFAEHQGYSYYTSRGALAIAEGEARASEKETSWIEIEVELSKSGVIKALNIWGGHADNG